MDFFTAGVIGVLLGILARALVPWLVAVYQSNGSGIKWNWTLLRGQAIGVIIVIILAPFIIPDLMDIPNMAFMPAWSVGWFAGDVGRLLEKIGISAIERRK